MAINLPPGWRAGVPVVQIPRHPLWMASWEGAWDVFEQWAARGGAADPGETAAIAHYARYAYVPQPLHAWLDQQVAASLSPLHAWSEWSLYEVSGDAARLARALPGLRDQYDQLRATRRRGNADNPGRQANGDAAAGLYYWAADEVSLEQSPRAPFGWVDLSAQQALAAELLGRMSRATGAVGAAETHEAEGSALRALIEQRCWEPSLRFYADCGNDGAPQALANAAGLWPLLGGTPSPERASRLAAHLSDPGEFWRVHVFAGLSADHPRYSDRGYGRRGAVWPLDNYAIIKGLERYGLHELARRAADNHVTTLSHVYKETLSHWDHYAPDYIEPGTNARHDAAGTGVSAIALLLETVLGLHVDAPARTLHWRPSLHETYSVEGLRVGSALLSLHVTPEGNAAGHVHARVQVSEPLRLHVSSADGEQWLDVNDELSFSVAGQITSP